MGRKEISAFAFVAWNLAIGYQGVPGDSKWRGIIITFTRETTQPIQIAVNSLFDSEIRWLPRVITNIVLIERELENET